MGRWLEDVNCRLLSTESSFFTHSFHVCSMYAHTPSYTKQQITKVYKKGFNAKPDISILSNFQDKPRKLWRLWHFVLKPKLWKWFWLCSISFWLVKIASWCRLGWRGFFCRKTHMCEFGVYRVCIGALHKHPQLSNKLCMKSSLCKVQYIQFHLLREITKIDFAVISALGWYENHRFRNFWHIPHFAKIFSNILQHKHAPSVDLCCMYCVVRSVAELTRWLDDVTHQLSSTELGTVCCCHCIAFWMGCILSV